MAYERQLLLLDADDTLWETNIQFERVNDAFLELVSPLGYDAETVRGHVDRTERNNIQRRGYGMRSFLHSLEEVYLFLAGHHASEEVLAEIRRLVRFFGPPRLMDGVMETLDYLSGRHHLHLFSKGNYEEQVEKFNGSGLERHFDAWDIVPEKDKDAYRALIDRHGWPIEKVWMVGNSPRSDINPALAAGLNAVFIPSAVSWDYEDEEIQPGAGKLLRLQRFADLRNHF